MSGKMIWAPWRSEFILSKKEKGCVFCNRLKQKDSIKNLILYRGEKNFVILNKYPYNSGHVMVVPMRHIGTLEKMTASESNEFFELVRTTIAVTKRALKPDGMNLGMNLGRTAGAGVPGHVHMHIVPRWTGDTNFMPVVGKTEVISVGLDIVYKSLSREFAKL
jgi:ATP adenylyltransferase